MRTIVPAYGRDYKSLKEAMADWQAGKDFLLIDMFSERMGYCNIRDFPTGTEFKLRYGNQRKVGILKA